MDEYIKRSEVVDLIERKIKNCVTVPGAFVCASLRTAVMGLRPSDVAPRAEIAEEIFAEIRLCWASRLFDCDDFSYTDFAFDDFAGDLDEIYKKYTGVPDTNVGHKKEEEPDNESKTENDF